MSKPSFSAGGRCRHGEDESSAVGADVLPLSGFWQRPGRLAGIGLHGVTAYGGRSRRAEIGIRMALGAAPAGIVRLVLARVFLLVDRRPVVGGLCPRQRRWVREAAVCGR
jgi:hypothetical protein